MSDAPTYHSIGYNVHRVLTPMEIPGKEKVFGLTSPLAGLHKAVCGPAKDEVSPRSFCVPSALS